MRRHDAAPASTAFYAPSPTARIFPDEANVNKGKKSWGERLKLGRGVDKDRPVPHQTPRDADNNPYLLQEYRNKYGTLSGGSALSKSMKYAEPWLYGSMSGPPGSNACPQRPALFLYHHPPPPVTVIPEVRQHSVVMVSPTSPASNYAVVVCSCPEFLTGTQRNKKNSPVCKKCGGSRVMWGGGTVRAPGHVMTSGGTVTGMGGTVRVGVGGPTRIRPSLLSVKPLPSNPPPQKPMTPDPYDMMRRNRLGSITPTEMSRKFSIAETTEGRSRQSQFETGRVRAKSTSPGRRNMRRSPSPPSRDSRKAHRHSPESQRRLSRRELEWEEDNLNLNFAMDSPDGSKRKSILECDVNAYELIAKYLKNGGKLLEDRNGGKRLNNETFTSDDDVLDDDELSDNMSDNALEDLPKSGIRNSNERFIAHKNMSRLPSSTASHLKTDRNTKRRFESVQKTKPVTSSNKGSSNSVSPISNGNSPRSCGITIGGQTIKIFNGSNPSTVEEDGEYVSDDAMIDDHVGSEVIHDIPRPTEEIKENQRVTRSSPNNSMIPRLSSPRRPPRKLKNSFGGSNRDETESFVIEKSSTQVTNSGPAESGSLSISHAGTNVTSSPLPEVSTIKSILKKPSTTSPGATEASPSLKTFGDTISKPDRSASGGGRRAASITTTTTNTSPSPLTGSASCTAGSNFYLPTFQEYKQQNRKKKQVQFKVAGDEQVTQVQHQPDGQHAVSPPSSDYVINPSSLKRPLPKTGQDGPLIAVKNDIKAKATQNDVPTITQDNAEENVITVISDEKVQKSFDTTISSSNEGVLTSSDTVEDRVTLEGRLKGGDFQYFGDSEGDTTVLNCSGVLKSSYEQDEFGTAPDHGVVGQSIPAVYFGQYGVSSLLDELSQPGSTTTVVTLRRSLSERLSTPPISSYLAEHRRAAVLFNDTMRLRQRGVRHSDARLVFSDPGSPSERITISNPIPIDRKHQRMLSPVRPRPKEPPPPPPPPPNVPHTLPEIPPRQIFPFSKKHIEEIIKPNHQSPSGVLSHQSQTVPAKQKTSSGRKIPPAPPIPIKPRPSSWSPPHLTTASADRGDTLSIVVKKEHRNSDPGPSPSLLRLHVVTTDPETSGAVHGVRFETSPDMDQDPKPVENLGNARSVVTVSSPSVGSRSPHGIHRLEIINGDSISTLSKSRRTSILINGEDTATVSNTSLVIDNQSGCKKDNINRVTISVGGDISGSPTAYGSPVMNRSSSCTVIDTSTETRYNRSSSLTLVSSVSKSTTVIPVSPDPHPQDMLLFLDHCTNVEVNGESSELELDTSILKGDVPKTCSNITLNGECDNTKNENSTKEVDACDTNPLYHLSCNRRPTDTVIAAAMQDSEALWDPVEAVKRNLVPHVCGKNDSDVSSELDQAENCSEDVDTISLLSEKLKEDFYVVTSTNARILESRLSKDLIEVPDVLLEATEDENEEECDYNSHLPIQASRNSPSTLDASLTGVSKVDDLASDDDSDFITGKVIDDYEGSSSIKDENEECESTRHLSLSLPRFILEEKDTQDDEVDVLGGKEIGEDDENIYDSIKEHIYEELPDTPPPLPLSPPPSLDDLEEGKRGSRSIFEGASKYDILSYLEGAKERGIVPEECYYSGGDSANGDEILDDKQLDPSSHERMNSLDLGDLSSRVSHLSNNSDSSEDSCNLIITNIDDEAPSDKVRKSSADIERNDSGVGSETSKSSRSRWQQQPVSISEDQQHLCEDCDQPVETQVTDSGVMFAPLVCRKCGKKRAERKETIAEIVETEEKYGRDLRIILEEFYRPMLVAGLLTAEQLAAIFLNSEELFDNSTALADKLRDNLEIAIEQGDEDLLTVDIGKLFLEAAPMLHAFESYCTRQAAASLLLANLEKEKELLRIFLRVSQMENAVLRRMNLNSFLMVPVQRVTKYPLLLARLYKVTPSHHEGRELLKQAQHKIELHLEHMNAEAKDFTSTKLWRRISIINLRRSSSEVDMINIKLRKMALDILEWNHDEARFVMEGKLLYSNPTDNNWRRGRTIKLNTINALLVTNGKPTEEYRPDLEDEVLLFPKRTGVREATLLLLKEKCGRYSLIREPLYLDKCIVCCEADWEEYFEVQELASKDTFIFKAEDGERTKAWYRQLQYHAQGLGAWRKRRNALANIMINGMLTRN